MGAHLKIEKKPEENSSKISVAVITTDSEEITTKISLTIQNLLLLPYLKRKLHYIVISKNFLDPSNLIKLIMNAVERNKEKSSEKLIQFFLPEKAYQIFVEAVQEGSLQKFLADKASLMSINQIIEQKCFLKLGLVSLILPLKRKQLQETFKKIFQKIYDKITKENNGKIHPINFLLDLDTCLIRKDLIKNYLENNNNDDEKDYEDYIGSIIELIIWYVMVEKKTFFSC